MQRQIPKPAANHYRRASPSARIQGTAAPTPPTPTPIGPSRRGISYTVLIIAIIIVGGLLAAAIASSFLTVSTKPFAPYSSTVSSGDFNPSSLEVSNVNGGVTLVPWNRSDLLVNGTVTARGFGTSTDAITFAKSNTTGHIVFQAIFPTSYQGLFLPSYSVDIIVHIPATVELDSVQITTTNGYVKVSTVQATSITLTTTNGNLEAHSITTDRLTLTSTNGSVGFDCTSCRIVEATSTNGGVTGVFPSLSLTGSYRLSTTNGGVALTLPASSSFKLTANTTNGGITTTGLGLTAQSSHSLTATLGTGAATVNLNTTNGSITITGT